MDWFCIKRRKEKGRQEVSSKGIDANGLTKDAHVISKRIMITIGSCRTNGKSGEEQFFFQIRRFHA